MPSTTSIEISRPPEQVFAYVTDPSRFVEWQDGVVSGHLADDGPVAVGHRCITTRRIGFAERAITSEITRLDPPRAWGVHGIDGPIRAVVDVTVEARDGGRSEVTIGLDFTGHGIGKLLVPLVVRPAAGREMHANLQRLKERIEAG